jgi:tetratricopeptide (TPR) repeat protein
VGDIAGAAITRLEAELAQTPKTSQPYEHALLAHRLGLAYAEAVAGRPEERLRRALACFDAAAALLDPRFHPVEHARVLTAAGSARRSLGQPAAARDLFARAVGLAADHVSGDEASAMANNVGLALLDLGDAGRAIERFDEAVKGFDIESAEGRRGRASALHNRGLSRGASGRPGDLMAAMADFDAALGAVDFDEAPLHHGFVQHSRGVAAAALVEAQEEPEAAERWRRGAIEAFSVALDIFGWPEHAVHHGIASFNLGRAWARTGDVGQLRRALLCFEDAVTAFDPRHQAAAWRQAYDALLATEARLAQDHDGWARTDHLLALLHDEPDDAPRLVRRRLARWLPLPPAARDAAVGAFAEAAARQGGDIGANGLVLLLAAAMELPIEAQAAVLDALLAVRAASDDGGREALDHLVDRAVGEAVVGPQRVFVRDHLVAGGFERP